TVYGHAGAQDELAASTLGLDGLVPFLAPVVFHGQAGDDDFGQYYDYYDPTAQTYTLRADPTVATRQLVQQPGSNPVAFHGVTGVILYSAIVGGNQINVLSVAQGVGINVGAADADVVTIGSLAPNLGGTLANINGPVLVGDEGPTHRASLI